MRLYAIAALAALRGPVEALLDDPDPVARVRRYARVYVDHALD